MITRILGCIVLVIALTVPAGATNNTWQAGSGKWEVDANWSLGVAPSLADSGDVITGNVVVTIDATTSGSAPGTLSVSNLFIGGSGPTTAGNPGFGGELDLVNAGLITPLAVVGDVEVKPGSTLIVSNSILTVRGLNTLGGLAIDGTFRLDSGEVLGTNQFGGAPMEIGGSDVYHDLFPAYIATHGSVTVNDGTLMCGDIFVGGETVRANTGTLTINGGASFCRILHVSAQNNTGTVWVTGGEFTANLGGSIGEDCVGQMTISNGTVTSHGLAVGNQGGSHGILNLVGGTLYSGDLTIGYASATGEVWMSGGSLVSTDGNGTATLTVGNGASAGQMTVSNGTVMADFVKVGGSLGNSLTLVGGTFSMDRDLDVGTSLTATGTVWVTGGTLIATNAPISVGSSGPGRLVLSNGTVQTRAFRVGTDYVGATLGIVDLLGGTLVIGGMTNGLAIGPVAGSTGTVNITGGSLTVTNGTLSVGNNGTVISGDGTGKITVSNGTLVASSIVVGNSTGTQCDFFLTDGGVLSDGGCPSGTNCQIVINSLGFQQTNGTVNACSSPMQLGVTGPGDCMVSGASANDSFQYLYTGYSDVGTFTLAGGVVSVCAQFDVGHYGLDVGSVIATGAVWVTGGQLTMDSDDSVVGNSGVGQMSISNGVVTAAKVTVGNSANVSSFGTLTLAGGTLTMSSLVLPNAHSRFIFTGGWLNVFAITNANGQMLTLGNDVTPITINLRGGVSSFGSGVRISTNATLSGFGTVTGTVVNFGLIASSSSLLTFTGGNVTNNGTMLASGAVIEAYGTVVNNGTIDIINGGTNFHGAFINNGTVLDAHSVRVSSTAISSNNVIVQIPSVTGHTYQLQVGGSLTATNWTNFGASQGGTGGVLTFTDAGGATNVARRLYRIDVTAP